MYSTVVINGIYLGLLVIPAAVIPLQKRPERFTSVFLLVYVIYIVVMHQRKLFEPSYAREKVGGTCLYLFVAACEQRWTGQKAGRH